jgi:ribosomal protein S18
MLKLFNSNLRLCANNFVVRQNVYSFHVCTANNIKKIEKTINKEKNLITIEGKYLNENELDKGLKMPLTSNVSLELVTKENANSDQEVDHQIRPCAFCELEKKNIYVQYSDVLILRQFMTEDGVILPRKVHIMFLVYKYKTSRIFLAIIGRDRLAMANTSFKKII